MVYSKRPKKNYERAVSQKMSDFRGLYDIRDYRESDKAFVMATFLRGLYYGDTWFSIIPKRLFMDNYKLIAEKLISSPKVSIKVACLLEDPEVILGYSILSSDYQGIHWTFVKSAWRLKGIASSISPQFPTYVTHLSTLGKTLLDKKFKNTVFNPFQIG